jgi:Xaa-Pro aminopeptidase
MNSVRIDRIRGALAAAVTTGGGGLDGLLVMSPHNRMYMTGFTGSSGYVLLAGEHALLLTDFRYVVQAATEAPCFDVIRHASPYRVTLAAEVAARGISRLGFEAEHVSVAEHRRLEAELPGVTLVPAEGLLEQLRLVKDSNEIERIAAAVDCSDKAFAEVLAIGAIKPGATELSVAAALESAMRRGGSTRPAFDTIVASGPRSALPHGRASGRVICAGDLVTMDFGATVDGYCSDITRTVIVGEASAEQRRLYDLVLAAQLAGVDAIRAGRTGCAVDAVAREIIAAAGHAEHFGHGLGHGVGLAVHEGPRLSTVGADDPLVPGMVTSVEPGVYIPGWGGVRIEDLVVVTQDGCQVLTKAPKQLIEVR